MAGITSHWSARTVEFYTRDPNGHIVELATVALGFTADEPLEALGSALKLPPWLEPQGAHTRAFAAASLLQRRQMSSTASETP